MKRSWYVVLVLLLGSLSHSFAQEEGTGLAEVLGLVRSGQYEQSEQALEGRLLDSTLAQRLRIELLERRGRFEEAEAVAASLLRGYEQGRLSTSDDLANAGYAAWRLQDWETANSIYIRAARLPEPSLSLYVDWGTLYLEKFNPGEAESIFREGLEVESSADRLNRWNKADLYAGLAQALRDQTKPGFSAFLDLAEKIDPENVRLLALRASTTLQEEDFEETQELLSKGLEKDPGSLQLLELQAALDYFREDTAAFEVSRQKVLDLNPRDGHLFEYLGDLAVARRRLQEAIDFYTKAQEVQPNLWTALASKGINLLRLGREEEGTAALEQAYTQDPYNLATVNSLRLLDSFRRFQRFETEHFEIKLRNDEYAVLKPYVTDLLERCLTLFEEKYQHQIERKVVFEMFPDHEDFAVRTLGMPGLGALGATIGNIVAMDSPSARPAGTFHWASTAWHELAHVVTLSLSNYRVPRWFTEGISMLEEHRGGAGWGEGLDPHFIKAWEEEKLLPIADLNRGFIRPEFPQQVGISYVQAGWICEILEREFGVDKIREMLVAYGTGLKTEEVFEQVLGKTTQEIDEIFQAEAKQTLALYSRALKPLDSQPEDLEGVQKALADAPDSYTLHLLAARYQAEAGDEAAAEASLRRAIELFPFIAGPESPYASLLSLLTQQGRTDDARSLLDAWWKQSPMMIENLFKLARLMAQQGDAAGAAARLQEGVHLAPLSTELHSRLGDLYLEAGKHADAIRELRVLLALNPIDPSSAHYKLASAHFQQGELDQARLQVLQALEIAPSYEEAQKLLLQIVRK